MNHVNYVIRNQCRTSAYGPVMFQEPEHHRNIALATKAMQEWTVLALIACLSPSSLSSSCNPTRLRGAFSQRSGLLDTSWSSAGNGNCITLRKALDLCVLAMTRVSHAVLLYSISPYAVIGKIYDSCAKEPTNHAKNTVRPRMNKVLFLERASALFKKKQKVLRGAKMTQLSPPCPGSVRQSPWTSPARKALHPHVTGWSFLYSCDRRI